MIEKNTAPYGLRLVREGNTIGEIPFDNEVEAIKAYFKVAGDEFYRDMEVEPWVIYNTVAEPNQVRVGEHLPREIFHNDYMKIQPRVEAK